MAKLDTASWRMNVPRQLQRLPRWVGHRAKVPVSFKGGAASSTDPATWGTFEEAARFYREHEAEADVGVGFVFSAEDRLIFFDLDHAIGEDGKAKAWARDLVKLFGGSTYVERSPSGTGLHAFYLGDLPRVEGASGGSVQVGPTKEEHLEAYAERRYSTITGDRVGRCVSVKEDREAVQAVLGLTGLGEKLLRPAPAEATAEGEEPERAPEVAAALAHLDPDLGYADWVAVGMALKAGLGSAGRELWLAWCGSGAKHVPGEPAEKWASFQRGGVGLGTLFKMAEAEGWRPPWRAKDALDEFADVEVDASAAADDIPYHTEFTGKALLTVRGPENVSLFFSRDPKWKGRLRWNVRTGLELDGRELTDADLVDLSGAVSRAFSWSPAVGKDTLYDGLLRAAHADEYDPVVEWLDEQRWDGRPRLDQLAADVGLEDNDATRRYLRRWFIGAVARAKQPGCEMQTMLVFTGPQGAGKSRLLKRLAVRPEWYRESHVTVGDKDAQLAVLAPWVVEVGELAGMSRADVDKVKVFVSEAESRFRRPYGKVDERHPRRCVFAGTTNEDEFNRDATGARRQWTVAVEGELRLPSEADVAQLWAEARIAYEAGERWWEDNAEMGETLERGAERFVESGLDVEVERLAEELAPRGATTMAEVLALLRDRGVSFPGQAPTSAIGHALKRSGWVLRRTKLDGKVRRVWRRVDSSREAELLALRRSVLAGDDAEGAELG